jgi:hypothetical protein
MYQHISVPAPDALTIRPQYRLARLAFEGRKGLSVTKINVGGHFPEKILIFLIRRTAAGTIGLSIWLLVIRYSIRHWVLST